MLQKKTTHKKAVIAETSHEEQHQAPSGSVDTSAVAFKPGMGSVVLSKYPGYTGALDIKGSVNVSVVRGNVSLSWAFIGTEDLCNTVEQTATQLMDKAKPNSCGLHFHKGTSCDTAESVGGHYYNGKQDPWSPVVYVSYEGGSVGSTTVAIGQSIDELAGHAFVVHDHTGGRVACGLLKHAVPGTKSGAAGPGSMLVALLSLLALPTLFAPAVW